jgi:hypothetical protein
MNNLKLFKKAATEKGYNFYYDRSLKLYALYKKDYDGNTEAQYFTKELIENVISIDTLIEIHIT